MSAVDISPHVGPERELLERLHFALKNNASWSWQLGEALQKYGADDLTSAQWSLLWRVTRLYAELDAACVEAARSLRVPT
jgi:hypothetical protein